MIPSDLNKLVAPVVHTDQLKRFRHAVLFLVGASLQLAHLGGGRYALLESQRHQKAIGQLADAPSAQNFRPDVVYQCLRGAQNSVLNRVGMLSVFVRTQENVLIFVSPRWRCPDTYEEFASAMGSLLVKRVVRSERTGETLLRVLKNDVEPLFCGCPKIGFELGGEPMRMEEIIRRVSTPADACRESNALSQYSELHGTLFRLQKQKALPLVFVVGAMAKGNIGDYASDVPLEHTVSLSSEGLTAHAVCENLFFELEQLWLF